MIRAARGVVVQGRPARPGRRTANEEPQNVQEDFPDVDVRPASACRRRLRCIITLWVKLPRDTNHVRAGFQEVAPIGPIQPVRSSTIAPTTPATPQIELHPQRWPRRGGEPLVDLEQVDVAHRQARARSGRRAAGPPSNRPAPRRRHQRRPVSCRSGAVAARRRPHGGGTVAGPSPRRRPWRPNGQRPAASRPGIRPRCRRGFSRRAPAAPRRRRQSPRGMPRVVASWRRRHRTSRACSGAVGVVQCLLNPRTHLERVVLGLDGYERHVWLVLQDVVSLLALPLRTVLTCTAPAQ